MLHRTPLPVKIKSKVSAKTLSQIRIQKSCCPMLRSKRVLHVTRAAPPNSFGGLERAVRELAIAQQNSGVDAFISEVPPDSLDLRESFVRESNWEHIAITGQFVENAMPFDVLHVHDWYGVGAAEFWFRRGHRSIVATAHLPTRRGFTYRDTQSTSSAVKALLEFRLFDLASKIIAPSPFIRRYLVEEYGLPDSKITIVPQGVGATFLSKPTDSNERDRLVVLYVGRITAQKGVELLIRSFPRVMKVHSNALLKIVGEGDAQMNCQTLVSRMGLASCVIFQSPLPDRGLVEEYRRASLLVMPSIFEPFGLVGLEAMASGCPVLSISPTGACYLKDDEVTPHFSPSRLGGAIADRLSLKIDKKSRQVLRDRARQFSWEKTSNLISDLYETLG